MSHNHIKNLTSANRALTEQESVWLNLLLAGSISNIEIYKQQAALIKVKSICKCGCASIVFDQIKYKDRPAPDRLRGVLSEAVIDTDKGEIDLLLHTKDGLLEELEVLVDQEPKPLPKDFKEISRRLF